MVPVDSFFRDFIKSLPKSLLYDDENMRTTVKTDTSPSVSAFEKKQMVFNNVRELLECPVCLTLMSSPIYQCSNGHTLCSKCEFRVKNCCPICGVNMGSSIRCLALEKVAKSLEVPYNCPHYHRECTVTGNIPELVTHLKDVHDAIMDNESAFDICHTQVNKRKNGWILEVLNCYGCYFCFVLQTITLGYALGHIAYFLFMGEENEAKNFSYSVEIGGDGRKLTYKGVPRSICTSCKKFVTI